MLFIALVAIGKIREQAYQPPQVIEVATLFLQQPQSKLELSSPAPPVAAEPVKIQSPPVIKPKEKSKPKPKNKPREQASAINAKPDVEQTSPADNLPAGSPIASTTGTDTGVTTGSSTSSTEQIVPADYHSAGLHNPPTYYPRMAVERGYQGTVKLRVQVLANGQPAEVQIAASSGYAVLDQAAVEQVKDWRFLPARRGGQPIVSWVMVPIKFIFGFGSPVLLIQK
jgi:protein TonB